MKILSHHPISSLFLGVNLLLKSTFTALASEEATTTTKTFRFKDDFFLKSSPLRMAIAPANAPELLAVLEEYGETFWDQWVVALMEDLKKDEEECEVLVRH